MAQIEVRAIKAHSPDGVHRYKVGDRYHVSESAARILVATKFVKIHQAEPESEAVKESKRHYNRRDLRAED